MTAISWSNMYRWSVDFLYSQWHPLISFEMVRGRRAQSLTASLQMPSISATLCFYAERPAIFIQRMLFLTRACIDLSLTSLQLGNHCFLSIIINCMCATRERAFILKSYPLPCLPVSPYTGSRIIFIIHLRQRTSQIVGEVQLSASEMLVRCFKDTQRTLLRMSSPIGSEKQFYTLARCRFNSLGGAGGRGRNSLLTPPPHAQ